MKISILDANTLGQGLDFTIFNQFGDLEIYDYTTSNQLMDRIIDTDIIITNKIRLTDEMKLAKNLKLICLTATGTNTIDIDMANQLGIRVTNIVGYSTNSVAQHTYAMLFYLMEKMKYYDHYVQSGGYINDTGFNHYEVTFHDLTDKTIGIIGLGNIGKKVAKIGEAFGANIIYYSTSGNNNSSEYKRVSLETLLKASDVISVHAPLNEATYHLINADNFKFIKPSAYLINVGRGDIVDEKAISKAIKEERIAGVGVDVLSKEPMALDCPLRQVMNSDRLLITPHVAWASLESRNKAMEEIALNIDAFLSGSRRNCVGKH